MLRQTRFQARCLLYHDVVSAAAPDLSGFAGPSPARYKLTEQAFDVHLQAIARLKGDKPALVERSLDAYEGRRPWLLTFDDGGVSAYTHIAPRLERLGWRGHFLVTVGLIDTPGFMTSYQVRELQARGHVVGTHSYSHPDPMSALSAEQLAEEWTKSVQVLSELLGAPVTVASVPGGFYTSRVGEAAAGAGIKVLFTSEPTTRVRRVGECWVLGRYTLLRGMPPGVAAGLTVGRAWPRMEQWLSWQGKWVAKTLGGRYYFKVRRFLLDHALARR